MSRVFTMKSATEMQQRRGSNVVCPCQVQWDLTNTTSAQNISNGFNTSKSGIKRPNSSNIAFSDVNHNSVNTKLDSRDSLVLYVDGACKGNNNVKAKNCPAGWGVAVLERKNCRSGVGGSAIADLTIVEELFGPVVLDTQSPFFLGAELGSNNTAELSAIGEALAWIRDVALNNARFKGWPIEIKYDSEYAAKSIMGEYNGSKNRALILRIRKLYEEVKQKMHRITPHASSLHSPLLHFSHVYGHSGDSSNDRADALANRGASGQTCISGRYASSDPNITIDQRILPHHLSSSSSDNTTSFSLKQADSKFEPIAQSDRQTHRTKRAILLSSGDVEVAVAGTSIAVTAATAAKRRKEDVNPGVHIAAVSDASSTTEGAFAWSCAGGGGGFNSSTATRNASVVINIDNTDDIAEDSWSQGRKTIKGPDSKLNTGGGTGVGPSSGLLQRCGLAQCRNQTTSLAVMVDLTDD